MARLQYFFDTISIAKKFVMHVNKQHLASKMQCYCSSKAAPDFLKYSQEDIKGLDRKTLQLICKAIGISRGIKVSGLDCYKLHFFCICPCYPMNRCNNVNVIG